MPPAHTHHAPRAHTFILPSNTRFARLASLVQETQLTAHKAAPPPPATADPFDAQVISKVLATTSIPAPAMPSPIPNPLYTSPAATLHALLQTIPVPLEDDGHPPPPLTQRHWRAFADPAALASFVAQKQASGEPVHIPPPTLSQEDATALKAECDSSIKYVTEEFRKYRVRTEVQKKEMEGRIRRGERQTLEKLEELNASKSVPDATNASSQIETLKRTAAEQETQWREAYDALLRENDQLKTKGAEATLASQWRMRYEQTVREKEELQTKMTMVEARLSSSAASSTSSQLDGGNFAEKYQKLRDEYSLYRKEAKKILEGYRSSSTPQTASSQQRDVYLKNTLIQYLSVADLGTRERMEPGIIMALGLSDEEVKQIGAKKKTEASASGGWF